MVFWLLITGSVTLGVILGWCLAGVMEGQSFFKKLREDGEKKPKE